MSRNWHPGARGAVRGDQPRSRLSHFARHGRRPEFLPETGRRAAAVRPPHFFFPYDSHLIAAFAFDLKATYPRAI
ncbi:jg781 [Pararge aegeria aegeria]|uniref:Jg781 protein n=1 Tax=Pararge aegeria aegeria TaxID=348720 RepID=A0A8S4S756_9NEOP|nr:jg781 [Pararge aegeria aegeria]